MSMLLKRLLFVFFLSVLSQIASAQLTKIYYINSPSQLTKSNHVNCGVHYTDWDNPEFGFKWTDNLPAGVTINSVQIELNMGLNFGYMSTSTNLNGASQGDMMGMTDYWDCMDRTEIISPSITTGDYVRGGLNTFVFDAGWGSLYLCKTPSLNNSFAKVTVSYTPAFPGGAAPTISSLSTGSGLPCSQVTIYGTNFTNSVNYVVFNDALATDFTVISATELVATVPADATSGPIKVLNNGGMATSTDLFTVNTPAAPVITGISATSGTVNNTLVITGTDFSCATAVTIGGTAVKSFTVNSTTQITAIVGYGTTGSVDVTTPGGTGSYGTYTYASPSAAGQMNISGSSSLNNTSANTATIVSPELTVTSNGLIDGFTVSISEGYTAGDELGYSGALPSGISTTGFNSTTGVLVFTGSMLAADWQEFLRRVTFQSTSSICFPERRKVSFTAGNRFYNPLTGHFYEYVNASIDWPDAKNAAAARSFFGRQGYLATITSPAENNFIWKIMNSDAWFGASDDYMQINEAVGSVLYADQSAAEANYYWITGPEKGQQFSINNTPNVTSFNGRYQNWAPGEPNNCCGGEHYAQIYSSGSGQWNDLFPNSLSYIVEYGDMPGDNTSNNVVFTKELAVAGASSGSISGGNVTVCEGTNSTTLTLNNLTGSVEQWEWSYDNFLTAGTAISNNTTSLVVENISQTTYYRAVVNSTSPATCNSLATSAVPVIVAVTEPGTVDAVNNTICEGTQAELTLFGNSGDVLQWQVATDAGFTNPTTINNTTTTLNHTLSTAGTYYFRAQVQNNGCGAAEWSTAKTISVNVGTPPVGGSVNSFEHLAGTQSGTLTLSGNTGTVSKWQASTDNGLIWTDISNTNATYDYTVNSSTQFRAVVTNAGCGSAYSNAGTVRVYANNQYVWKGTNNTDWNTNGNWLENTKPVTGADVIISNTAANHLVIDQQYTLNELDFNGSNRKVQLGNYNLILNNIIGADANNYFQTNGIGQLRKSIANGSSFAFPVGNSTYNPVTISNNTGAGDQFSVRVLDEVYANGSNGSLVTLSRVQRTWDISKANSNAGSGINFVFNWNAGDIPQPLSSAALYHYGTSWDKQTGTTNSTSTSLTYTGYTGSFSPFAVMESSSTLPVSWLSFTAARKEQTVQLQWQTATEQNTKDFVVQHSTGNSSWSSIGTVAAAGNSQSVSNYKFTHLQPVEGSNYYRLIQRDVDGKQSISKTVQVQFTTAARMQVYPTPVTNGVLHVKLPADAVIRIYNSNGSLVLEQKGKAGLQQLQLSLLGKGSYYLRAGTETATILVQ
ncbi:putative secreted protein (Por secretion system target) [Lacibacter cauensis]|uniref:Putative secreted protein (Por secretion system target) n=1 Tax=Lacibacter cauensis TaxID=510947 RepID=A0A562SIH7_9BACT|nr:T9SS type A sorting domain-containing protein [Lacibacter cauensis]TWI80566.1 putative secreted protein (Por secretion system target) [Lacibacter cauensis]